MNITVINEKRYVKERTKARMKSDMPDVLYCEASACIFNDDNICNAGAINVGGPDPICHTFMNSPLKSECKNIAKVGACKVADCYFNQCLECSANGITISFEEGLSLCDTYRSR